MTGNLDQDWPVYILLGAVAFFFIFVIIKGNLQNKENKQE
jgi:NADH:ubiquinone oxidoreductase subunit 6 (subunit J)